MDRQVDQQNRAVNDIRMVSTAASRTQYIDLLISLPIHHSPGVPFRSATISLTVALSCVNTITLVRLPPLACRLKCSVSSSEGEVEVQGEASQLSGNQWLTA